MGDLVVHAPLVGLEELLPSIGGEVYGIPASDEVPGLKLAVVDELEHNGVTYQWPELLHQVEGERRASEARAMEQPDERVEADGPRA